MTCPIKAMPRCTACGCLAAHHFYSSNLCPRAAPISDLGATIEWCQNCLEDERPHAIHKYTEEVSTMAEEVYDNAMNKCYRCGRPVDPEYEGPCHDGFYYCYECIIGDHCGCSIDITRPRGLLGRLCHAIRRLF